MVHKPPIQHSNETLASHSKPPLWPFFFFISLMCCAGIEPGPRSTMVKVNQDRGSVEWPFADSVDNIMFGVFDGHGKVATSIGP